MYKLLDSTDLTVNIILLSGLGILVNGPYSLITSEISAQLGLNPKIRYNSAALATVYGLIDGIGSMGKLYCCLPL